MYRDGNLVSGSLEALVQHMVPTEEYYPDRAYLFAFLLSARLFIKPHELLGEVCALCEHQQNLNGEGGKVSISILPICEITRSLLLTSRIHEGHLLLFYRKVMHPCLVVLSSFFHLLFFDLSGNINTKISVSLQSLYSSSSTTPLLLYTRMK